MATYPTGLPDPTIKYGISFDPLNEQSKKSNLLIRQRQRYTKTNIDPDINWLLNDQEYRIFGEWANNTISNTADWFDITIPLGDNMQLHTIKILGNSFSVAHVSHLQWMVKASCRVRDKTLLTETELDDALFITDIHDYEAASDRWYNFINVTLPSLFTDY